jgi:hypothetical protein
MLAMPIIKTKGDGIRTFKRLKKLQMVLLKESMYVPDAYDLDL